MKSLFITSSLAGIAALAATAALAQNYNPGASTAQDTYTQEQRDYQSSQDAYRDRVQNYQGRVEDFRERQEDYRARRERYEDQKAEADAQMDAYVRARDAYDARWGAGAYDRNRPAGYIPRPADFGAFPDYAAVAPPITAVGPEYRDTCRERRNVNAAARGYIGSMASSAIGNNANARSPREGPVLGATVDVRSENRLSRAVASCDGRGYFYSYDQTFPYRETALDMARRSGRFTFARYQAMRCRLAIAPTAWGGLTDYRYVRVCPDRAGRYRITS
jgi:hypothetical protein